MSDYIKAKVAFGELTLSEACELVWHRCGLIRVQENEVEKGTYNTFSKDEQGLYLFIDEDAQNPDYRFDAKVKVRVREDHVEFKMRGSEVSLYFLEAKPIRLGSLLPRR
jgi:hypothetical protein